MPRISVIIPVYNSEKFIERTVNSVLNQTFDDFEIILVDDGSSDNSLKVINTLAMKDKRIKAIHQENSGVSNARNTGMMHSSGKYFIFCDSDDEFLPDAFQVYMTNLCEFDYDLIISGFQKTYISPTGGTEVVSRKLTYSRERNVFSSKKEVVENLKDITGIDLAVYKVNIFNSVCNKIFKAETIRENKLLFPEGIPMGEDYRFNLAYLDCVNSALIISDITYNYIVNTSSATFRFRESDFKIRCKTLDISRKFHLKNGYDVAQNIYLLLIKTTYSAFANMYLKDNSNSKEENRRFFSNVLKSDDIREMLKCFKPHGAFVWLLWIVLKTQNYYLIMTISYCLYRIRNMI